MAEDDRPPAAMAATTAGGELLEQPDPGAVAVPPAELDVDPELDPAAPSALLSAGSASLLSSAITFVSAWGE